MDEPNAPPATALHRLDVLLLVVGGALLAAVLALSRTAAADFGDALTRNTVRLSLPWFAAALMLMTRLQRPDWAAATRLGRLARWCWTWGLVSYLVHVAMAFHYFHGWSHADAFEHTRQASGWGEGVYVSYAFTALWAGDVVWWWVRPSSFAARSPWLQRALCAFLLFVAFNGAVIFAAGAIRWVGLAGFAGLAIAWLTSPMASARRRG